MKLFTAAVVGCGAIGAREDLYSLSVRPGSHAGAYAASSSISLVALVDPDVAQLKIASKLFPHAAQFSDIDAMYASVHPDIISIATPTALHFEHGVRLVAHRPRVIICEKPLADSLEKARQIVALCRKNNILLFVNHQRHFDSLLTKWSVKVRHGFLGKIYQANAFYYNGLFRNGSHLIDLIRMFLGDPIALCGRYNESTSAIPEDKNIDGFLLYPNDCMVTIQSIVPKYDIFGIHIVGEHGVLDVTRSGLTVEYRKRIADKRYRGYTVLSSEVASYGSDRSMMPGMVDHVVSVLRGKICPRGTGDDALCILTILDFLRQSAKQKGIILPITI